MNIVVVGLGIIGGSFAKAIKKYTSHRVIGINRSVQPLQEALACGAIDEIGSPESLALADLLIIGLFPKAAVAFMEQNVALIRKGCIVIDTAGIKSEICPRLTQIAEENGLFFVGCHPMAGKETNGFASSEADLFVNASCILIPCMEAPKALETVSELVLALRFGKVVLSTPAEHDRMIAFTSQLPHAIACAYVLSEVCPRHDGFSAGSYRDVSRVAHINEALWSELFLENRTALITEIDSLIRHLSDMKQAMEAGDQQALQEILRSSRLVKEALGE